MKRLLYILLLSLLLAACSHEKVELLLYQQYASRQDLTVAQVKGFQLCDSVKVDVVILVADDSAAWQGLKEEFDIRTSEGVTSWVGDIDNPTLRMKGGDRPAWRAMAVHNAMTIAFYRIDTEEQLDALRNYQMNMIESNKRTETML